MARGTRHADIAIILRRAFLAAGAVASTSAFAAEGTTAAGPIGGTDIRSAILPPPGVYGAIIGLYSAAGEVDDGMGHPVAGFDAVNLKAEVAGGLPSPTSRT